MQFKMAKGQHRHHHYSAEEIMNTVMASSDSEQFSTDLDESDLSEVESFEETFKTSSPDGPQLQKKEKSTEIAVSPITAPNSQKVYVELQTVAPTVSSERSQLHRLIRRLEESVWLPRSGKFHIFSGSTV